VERKQSDEGQGTARRELDKLGHGKENDEVIKPNVALVTC
jgi:hypothetical protein